MQRDDNFSAFPKDFLWGSATASYQVEGGIENNDWALAARRGKVPVCGKACDHYNRYEQDFDIARTIGHNAHRFSIEWSRIEPEEGKFDHNEIEHYRKVLQALKTRNLEPFVTLWHFTIPEWFSKKGGFLSPDSVHIFSRYCEFVIMHLGNEAKFWMTMNEPLIYANGSYLRGNWPPFKKSIFSYLKIIKNLVRAHKEAYTKIKKVKPTLQVGIAKHNMDFGAQNFLYKPAELFMRWFWNHRFIEKVRGYQDFIGLNYYIHAVIGGKGGISHVLGAWVGGEKQAQKIEYGEMGWEIYPEGIRNVLLELKKYNLPIYITENGLADATDTKRADYIKNYLREVGNAIAQGVDVQGYFYWSLLDNYEWAFGFLKRFGLVDVNFDTQTRTIRLSAYVYKEIINMVAQSNSKL